MDSKASGPLRDATCSDLARLLRQARSDAKLSLNELAQQAGLSRQMVSYVEQEARNPSIDTLLRIAEALDTKLERLISKARKSALRKHLR